MSIPGYKDVRLIGNGGTFTLEYTPTRRHGRTQRRLLDATNEADACYEAARILWCDENDLPVITSCDMPASQ